MIENGFMCADPRQCLHKYYSNAAHTVRPVSAVYDSLDRVWGVSMSMSFHNILMLTFG